MYLTLRHWPYVVINLHIEFISIIAASHRPAYIGLTPKYFLRFYWHVYFYSRMWWLIMTSDVLCNFMIGIQWHSVQFDCNVWKMWFTHGYKTPWLDNNEMQHTSVSFNPLTLVLNIPVHIAFQVLLTDCCYDL